MPQEMPPVRESAWSGVDQADDHDGGGGGGLDGHGNDSAQGQADEGVGSHLFQQQFQLAAGHLFQAPGHDVHAVEEEGQTTDEGEDREDIHGGCHSFGTILHAFYIQARFNILLTRAIFLHSLFILSFLC